MEVLTLEWDSAFFGLRIGKVIINSLSELEVLQNEKEQMKKRYDLVYLCINNPGLYCKDRDALLVDKKVVFSRSLSGDYRLSEHVHPYHKNHPDEMLYRLALRSGAYSRFKTDPLFPDWKFEALYRKWIEKSVDDKHGIVLCYYNVDAIVGMMTLVIDDEAESAKIGLTAVDEAYSNQGVGSSLIETACSYLHGRGIKRFETVTQSRNIAACRWYEKNGFHMESVSNIYHLWLNCPNHEDSF